MNIIALGSLVVTSASIIGGGLYSFYRLKENINDSVKTNSKRISLIGIGVYTIMKEDPKLDSERFYEALENNGMTPEDFIKGGE